jgi:nitroreductase
MKNNLLYAGILLLLVFFIAGCTGKENAKEGVSEKIVPETSAVLFSESQDTGQATIQLPEPRYDGETSVEQAMKNRRSVRKFTKEALDITDVSQLLWAAQGITSEDGKRTAPSAQRLYPLEVYVIALNVNGLAPGTYHYIPQGHLLETIKSGNMSAEDFTTAPAAFVIAANLEKKPGARPAAANNTPPGNNMPPGNGSAPNGGPKETTSDTIKTWYYAEIGHAAQNMYLQSESLDLGMVTTGGFDADKLDSELEFPANVTPFYLIPAGHTG